eukprot:7206196-Heterocapsa_arctica.AAC.1
MGIEQKQCWSVCLKLKIGLKLRVCAKRLAFCEECNGDSEDARRPFKHLQQRLTIFQNPQSHIH